MMSSSQRDGSFAASPASAAGADAQRCTLRIRNIRESVVYHLLFDGDVGRLTGSQLKTHIFGICKIPVEQQLLTYNGQSVADLSTGYELNLKDGAMLVLDTMVRAPADGSVVRGSSNDMAAATQPQFNATSEPVAAPAAQRMPSSRLDDEIDALRRQEDEIMRRQDQLRRDRNTVAFGLNADPAHPTFGSAGVNDEIDVDVEVVEEPGKLTWQPTHSADVEEARMLQQDYVWRMEQVRFETERMNREREMRRQQQELEYQAELLDRERITVERRTQSEHMKFLYLQNQLRDDMEVQARATTARDQNLLY